MSYIDISERKDITDMTPGTVERLSFALNIIGREWISSTGYTKLGLREGHDIVDSAPLDFNALVIRTSEYAGIDKRCRW